MQETVLLPEHERLGARLVPFAGWRMPVQYRGILEEARTVRTKAGLFDLGHMGRITVGGRDAEAFLQRLQTNDASKIGPGVIRYSLILDEQGITQDDILVYRDPEPGGGFFVVVNAGNTTRDLELMRRAARGFANLQLADLTQELGMFAIQGPLSQAIVQPLCDADLSALKYYNWTRATVAGVRGSLSRTGYTGEDGFEFYLPRSHTVAAWNAVLAAGRGQGLEACGLGSRDTLRHEAGMALYGHEIDETTNPLEAGLGWAVKFTHDFTGRAALERIQQQGGTGRKLVGLVTDSRRVPRQGYTLHVGAETIGKVCSGNYSPTLERGIATAYVAERHAKSGTAVEFAVKDKREPATLVDLPFYKRAR